MTLMKEKKLQRIHEIIKAMMFHERMTLAEIVNKVNLSLPKVTEIVNELKKSGIVNELSSEDFQSMGRPSQKFQLNSGYGYFIGIDLGRVYTNIVVLDYKQNKIYENHLEAFLNLETKIIVKNLNVIINQILKEVKIEKEKLFGIGVSLPGIVDGKKGIRHTYLKIDGVTLKDYLE